MHLINFVSLIEFIFVSELYWHHPISCDWLLLSLSSPACEIEVPERLTVSHDALRTGGLAQRCRQVPVRQATEQEILLVHRLIMTLLDFLTSKSYRVSMKPSLLTILDSLCITRLYLWFCVYCSEEYLEAVKQTPKMTVEELMVFTKKYNDVYFHPASPFTSHLDTNLISHECLVMYLSLICRTSITVLSWPWVPHCSWWTALWRERSEMAWLWWGEHRTL